MWWWGIYTYVGYFVLAQEDACTYYERDVRSEQVTITPYVTAAAVAVRVNEGKPGSPCLAADNGYGASLAPARLLRLLYSSFRATCCHSPSYKLVQKNIDMSRFVAIANKQH